MKARDVLNLWMGWDSPDLFTVRETSPEGRQVAVREMTGVDFMGSPLADREIKRFGSSGKGPDGVWRHHVEIMAEVV